MCLFVKRLESGTFQFSFAAMGRKEIAAWELALLLEGVDVNQAKQRKRYARPERTASSGEQEMEIKCASQKHYHRYLFLLD